MAEKRQKLTRITSLFMIALRNKTIARTDNANGRLWSRKIVEIQEFWSHSNVRSHFPILLIGLKKIA